MRCKSSICCCCYCSNKQTNDAGEDNDSTSQKAFAILCKYLVQLMQCSVKQQNWISDFLRVYRLPAAAASPTEPRTCEMWAVEGERMVALHHVAKCNSRWDSGWIPMSARGERRSFCVVGIYLIKSTPRGGCQKEEKNSLLAATVDNDFNFQSTLQCDARRWIPRMPAWWYNFMVFRKLLLHRCHRFLKWIRILCGWGGGWTCHRNDNVLLMAVAFRRVNDVNLSVRSDGR